MFKKKISKSKHEQVKRTINNIKTNNNKSSYYQYNNQKAITASPRLALPDKGDPKTKPIKLPDTKSGPIIYGDLNLNYVDYNPSDIISAITSYADTDLEEKNIFSDCKSSSDIRQVISNIFYVYDDKNNNSRYFYERTLKNPKIDDLNYLNEFVKKKEDISFKALDAIEKSLEDSILKKYTKYINNESNQTEKDSLSKELHFISNIVTISVQVALDTIIKSSSINYNRIDNYIKNKLYVG